MSYNGVRPKNKAEAQIWNYFNGEKWDFWKIRVWPKYLAEATIQRKFTNRVRFGLMMYLVGNGMQPWQARGLILYLGQGKIDEEGVRHVMYLEKNIDRYLQQYKYYDERIKKWN